MDDAISVLCLTDPSFGIQYLQGFGMFVSPNRHAEAMFHGRVKKEIAFEKIKESLAGMKLGVSAPGTNEVKIFNGILQDVTVQEESEYAVINGRILSGTTLLDSKKKSRSFQDVSMTYEDIIDQVLKDTPEAAAIFAAGEYDKPIEKPIIQYKETDWNFICRMASRCKSCIIPDISESKPWFYFGIKQQAETVSFDEIEYAQMVGDQYYVMGGADEERERGDYYRSEVTSTQNYEIGDTTTFKNKSLKICKKREGYSRQELIFHYTLAKEAFNETKRYDNEKISGMTLIGTVLETAGETLKIHLDIDETQDPGKAYPYHWVPPSGNLMYLMPKIGTRVSLYFPDSDEQNAKAVNCVRTNGGQDGTCEPMGDFNERCLTTEHGKQVYFHPGAMGYVGGSGQFSQTDESGTVMQSTEKLKIIATENIEIDAPAVVIGAALEIKMSKG